MVTCFEPGRYPIAPQMTLLVSVYILSFDVMGWGVAGGELRQHDRWCCCRSGHWLGVRGVRPSWPRPFIDSLFFDVQSVPCLSPSRHVLDGNERMEVAKKRHWLVALHCVVFVAAAHSE